MHGCQAREEIWLACTTLDMCGLPTAFRNFYVHMHTGDSSLVVRFSAPRLMENVPQADVGQAGRREPRPGEAPPQRPREQQVAQHGHGKGAGANDGAGGV